VSEDADKSAAKGGRKRRRRRRPEGRSGSAPRTEPSGDSSQGGGARRKRKRRRGPSGPRRQESGRDSRPARPPLSDSAEPATEPKPLYDDALAPQFEEFETTIDERWGDDSDAPTPDVELAADLPPAPAADDPDPASEDLPELEDADAAIANVVGIHFAPAGKIYLYDGGDETLAVGDRVVVEGDRGDRLGTVAVASQRKPPPRGLRRVLRRVGADDLRKVDERKDYARRVTQRARELAREAKLPIKVFRTEATASRLNIYFSCDDKVDARRLSRSLSKDFPEKIELRQTGVRDEAKMIGGIGSCGMELCCSTWLPAFVPVSIKNAKDQGLVLNPSKVSGQCGRLKCCLVYEQETYARLRKGLPKLGKRVITPDGLEGRVVEVDVLRQRIRVNLGRGEFQIFGRGDLKPMFPSQPQGQPKSKKTQKRNPEAQSKEKSKEEPTS
jgi:cell fate regulator YaaT (PSP1 superfamily)